MRSCRAATTSTGWMLALGCAMSVALPQAAWALDVANIEGGYPLALDDTRILVDGEQTFTVGIGAPDALAEQTTEYLHIEVHQGFGSGFEVGFDGNLDNFHGNGDGWTGLETQWVPGHFDPGEDAPFALRLELDFDRTNGYLRGLGTAIGSMPIGGDSRLLLNVTTQLQEQKGIAIRQEVTTLALGAVVPMHHWLGYDSVALASVSWQEAVERDQRDFLMVDAGLRMKLDDSFEIFAGVGTNLENQPDINAPIRMVVGGSWDITVD
ncbi:MAG: hypothetical protein ABI743_03850 [bacterium]